eukprot:g971.t1
MLIGRVPRTLLIRTMSRDAMCARTRIAKASREMKNIILPPFVSERRTFSSVSREVEEEEHPVVSEGVGEEDVEEEEDVEDNAAEDKDVVQSYIEDKLNLTPAEVVAELDRFIVGQKEAKRAVAVALRNRWRRLQLKEDMKKEIIPKNILMIGPTGCGKTEIARRLSSFADAPFVKVEATKFTEVGFHGRDVDMIVRDLLEVGISLTKKVKREALMPQVSKIVNDRLLELLVGGKGVDGKAKNESFRRFLESGEIENTEVSLDVPAQLPNNAATIAFDPNNHGAGQGMNIAAEVVKNITKQMGGGRMVSKKMKISEAREVLTEMEMEKLLDNDELIAESIKNVEQNGIVFIDEIDKICSNDMDRGGDASAEGVQRDLLPLVEGSTISTKHGNVNTDYILFIASGAFHQCKPSDLLPELQGRLPIRVSLNGLEEEDLFRIMTEPETNIIRQQQALIGAENVDLVFNEDAVRHVAHLSAEINKTVENIGARRLYTVMERLMEDHSFNAAEMPEGSTLSIEKEYVEERVGELLQKTDLKKFIL